jgi:chromate transporter
MNPRGRRSGAGPAKKSGEEERSVGLGTVAREWLRIGCIGFGGPPAHIALLRKLCVEQRGWLSAGEFEDGVAATNLLPGPASTQLAMFCAWRLAGPAGAVLGGTCFILPGLGIILALAALFLTAHPPAWAAGAAAGAGAAVPAVALAAAFSLMPTSWRRAGSSPGPESGLSAGSGPGPESGLRPGSGLGPESRPAAERGLRWARWRWGSYLVAGGVAGVLAGAFLVLVLAACGFVELAARWPRARNGSQARSGGEPRPGRPERRGRSDRPGRPERRGRSGLPGRPDRPAAAMPLALAAPASGRLLAASALLASGGLLAVAWVAFKVGALSYGGGFVIIPLMQHDAVHTYHWMTAAQFLSAVALGQVTPGPVVQTVAVVGYAAAGVGGGLLASLVAFAPSFAFVLGGAPHFAALRRNARVQAFLTGAGPAAIGAIAGSTVPLGLGLTRLWQVAVLGLAAVWLVILRRNVVAAIVGAAGLGVIVVLAGAPLP